MKDEEFHNLMSRLRDGEPQAARELVLLHDDTLRRVIRQFLRSRPVRQRLDSADIAQDVWKSFFARDLVNHPWESFEAMTNYLAAVARKKTLMAVRDATAQKRDARRTESLPLGCEHERQVRASCPLGPVEELAAADFLEFLAKGVPRLEQETLALLGSGCTHQEVAERAGVSTKAVQRLVEKAQGRARREGVGSHGEPC